MNFGSGISKGVFTDLQREKRGELLMDGRGV